MNSPKALLRLSGESFVEAILGKMQVCGVHPVIVVAGVHYREIDGHLAGKCRVVRNERHCEGQFVSLQRGLQELLLLVAGGSGVVVWPVDQPLVRAETVSTLISAVQGAGSPLAIPVYRGRRGHPVIYGSEAVDRILTLGSGHTGKDVRRIFANRACDVEVADPGS